MNLEGGIVFCVLLSDGHSGEATESDTGEAQENEVYYICRSGRATHLYSETSTLVGALWDIALCFFPLFQPSLSCASIVSDELTLVLDMLAILFRLLSTPRLGTHLRLLRIHNLFISQRESHPHQVFEFGDLY